MLLRVLITLFTTGIKISWESQPLCDISLFHVGAEVALIFLTSGDFTRKFCSRWCVCMRVQIKWWRFERALLCKTKAVQVTYIQTVQMMRIFCSNTLVNRREKKSPLPCKGPCNVLQCAVFTLGLCCHMFVFTSLEMTREIPAAGCRAGPASFPLRRVVVLGWVLPAQGRNWGLQVFSWRL